MTLCSLYSPSPLFSPTETQTLTLAPALAAMEPSPSVVHRRR